MICYESGECFRGIALDEFKTIIRPLLPWHSAVAVNTIGLLSFWLSIALCILLVCFDIYGLFAPYHDIDPTTVHAVALVVIVILFLLYRMNRQKLSTPNS